MTEPIDPSTAPTRPAQRAMPEVPVRRTPITNIEIYDLLTTMRSENAREVGDIKREVRDVRDEQRAQRDELHAQRKEINALKTRPTATRGPLQSYSEIDDVAVSGSVLREALQKQKSDSRRATNTQTAAIIGALIALATAGAGWLNAQTERTRTDTAAAARTAATEAVREAAPAVAKEAVEAVKESVQNAPKGTP